MSFYNNINNDRRVRARSMSHELYYKWKELKEELGDKIQIVRIETGTRVHANISRRIDPLLGYGYSEDQCMTEEDKEYIHGDSTIYDIFCLELVLLHEFHDDLSYEEHHYKLELFDTVHYKTLYTYELL